MAIKLFPERGFMVVPIDGGPVKFMTYAEYIESSEWKARMIQYKAAAGWKCIQCESTTNLTGHHLTYINLGNEPINDIEILCWDCHKGRHQ